MTAKKLDPHEWDFNSIPEPQLVASCVWEYARESASIRKAVECAKIAFANQGIPKSESAEREAFRAAASEAFSLLHNTGFDLSFWVRLPFPEPWQSVDVEERQKWEHIRPEIPRVKFPPFQISGDICTVGELDRLACEANKKNRAALAKAARGEPVVNEAELLAEFLNPRPILLLGAGGVQSFMAQINWRDYTDRQIKTAVNEWVVNQRPTTIPEPSERGHKPIDWRKKLGDLGILRLMYETKVGNMKIYQPEAWRRYGCRGERYWYTASERALKDFRVLLRFLPHGELPLHADTKPDRAPCANR
jgi:hypothetical protein